MSGVLQGLVVQVPCILSPYFLPANNIFFTFMLHSKVILEIDIGQDYLPVCQGDLQVKMG